MEPRGRSLARRLGRVLGVTLATSCAAKPAPRAPLPPATVAHFLAGRVAYERGQQHVAISELRAAISRSPDEPELYEALLLAFARASASESASESTTATDPFPPELSHALQRWPHHPGLWHAAAELYQALGRSTLAESAYRRVLALEPSREAAAISLLTLLQERGDDRAAFAVARSLVSHVPGSAAGRLALARAFVDDGQPRAAISQLELALRSDPGALEARSLLASTLAHLGELEQAIAEARSAFTRSGEHPALAEPLLWLLGEAGERAAALDLLRLYDDEQRQLPELLAALNWAAQLGASELVGALATRALACARDEQEREEAVRAALEASLAVGEPSRARALAQHPAAVAAPADARAWWRARLASGPAEESAALEQARRVPAAERSAPLALWAARTELALGGSAAQARAWLPSQPGAPFEQLLARALLEHDLASPATARDLAERALALRAHSSRALAILAQSLVDSGELSSAERWLGRARALAPGRPVVLAALAHLRRAQGHLDEAVALLVRATTLAPHDPELAYWLGVTLAARGQRSAAAAAFARGLTLQPSPLLAARLRAARGAR